MRLILACFISLLIFQQHAVNASTGSFSSGIKGRDYVPGEILVKYKKDVSIQARSQSEARLGAKSLKSFRGIGVQHMRLSPGISVEEAVKALSGDPSVEYAEPNYIYHLTATPNDPGFSDLWGLENSGQTVNGTVGTADADMDLPLAWDQTVGSGGVVVAVIDSGVDYNHPDLAANIWTNPGEVPGNGTDDDGNGYVDDVRGWDFFYNDNDPMDNNGHGTHVSGTIGAVGNNAAGITGVNWSVTIMPLRAGNASGMLTTSAIIGAIDYARLMGADVINASFGGYGFSQATREAIEAFGAAGGLFVAAAGNEGNDNDGIFKSYPASYNLSNIISVAASDQDDALAYFSNFGATTVDVAAPGVNIYSTVPAAAQTVWSDDFDDGDISDWTSGGTNNTWAPDTALANSASYSLADSPDSADYLSNTNSFAYSPAINLAGKNGCTLSYNLWQVTEFGTDWLFVEASTDASTWGPLNSYTGSTLGAFFPMSEDLSGYDGANPLYVRFRLTSDSSTNYEGVNIDDVVVACASTAYSGTEYEYYAGTSMASPHVAGLAALVKAAYPVLSNLEIKNRILQSADLKTSLQGLVLTSGRANALNAMFPVPSSLSATAVSTSQIDLAWTDNSSTELGFRIERRFGSGGAFQEIATVGPDVTAHSDASLSPLTLAIYRVRAYTGNGNSAYSNEAQAVTPTTKTDENGNGSCFIATAAYGSYMADDVMALRRLRDSYLMRSAAGRAFVSFYYSVSPPLADLIRGNESMRALARHSLAPFVYGARHPVASMVLATALFGAALGICLWRRR